MKAHIVGGGFGGLAAAALLIRNAGCPERTSRSTRRASVLGGGFFLGGNARAATTCRAPSLTRNSAAHSICWSWSLPHAIRLSPLRKISSPSTPASRTRTKRTSSIATAASFTVRVSGSALPTVFASRGSVLTPEAMLDGRRIDEFFSQRFFSTEFWFLWSTIMGSLPQSSVIEFRRYMNRFLYLFGDLSNMTGVMRTPLNQHQNFVEPLVRWLTPSRRQLSHRHVRQGHQLRAVSCAASPSTGSIMNGTAPRRRLRSRRTISCS